jgi:hypothetical protein
MLHAPKSPRLGATSMFACVALVLVLAVTPLQAQTSYVINVAPSSINLTVQQADTVWMSLSVYEQSGAAIEFWTYNSQNWLYIDTMSVSPLITPESLYVEIMAGSLAPGTYVDSIIIDTYEADNTPIAIPVNLVVQGGTTDLELTTSPRSFDLHLQDGQTYVEDLNVYEIHGENVPFNVWHASPWITIGEYPAGPPFWTPSTLEVLVVLDTMPLGTYYDTLRIYPAEDTMSFPEVQVPITVTVDTGQGSGLIAAQPAFFNFSLPPDDSLMGQQLFVFETSGQSLEFQLMHFSDWLRFDSSATLPLYTPETVIFGVSSLNLAPGSYGDSIIISCDNATNSPLIVPVMLNVTGSGGEYNVATLPESLYFSMNLGEAQYDSLLVYETSGAPVGFYYTENASWLTVDPLGQGPWITPMTLLVSATSTVMGPGHFESTIYIYPSPDTTLFDPVAVPVSMDVGPLSPVILAAPDHFQFSIAPGDSILNLALLVYEQYGYGLPFGIQTQPGSEWLQIHYPDPAGPGWYTPDSVYFDLVAGDLAEGSYSDTIVIYDPLDDTLSWNDVLVPVSITVGEQPQDNVVLATPNYFNYVVGSGQTVVDSLRVYEVHGRAVSFWHYNSEPWLTVNIFELPPLTTPLSMPIFIHTDSLPVGSYLDSIWIEPLFDSTSFPRFAVPVFLVVSDSVPGDSVYCGDVDQNGFVNISDAVGIVNYIFNGGQAVGEICTYDCNGDGVVNISDAVYLIAYVFGSRTWTNNCCR